MFDNTYKSNQIDFLEVGAALDYNKSSGGVKKIESGIKIKCPGGRSTSSGVKNELSVAEKVDILFQRNLAEIKAELACAAKKVQSVCTFQL